MSDTPPKKVAKKKYPLIEFVNEKHGINLHRVTDKLRDKNELFQAWFMTGGLNGRFMACWDEEEDALDALENTPIEIVPPEWIRNKSDELAAANFCRFDAERGQYVCDWIERHCHIFQGEYAGTIIKLVPWERDILMRLFSWVRWDEMWKRWVRRFTRGSVWISKKNGKTLFIAGVGVYLLAGDGEQGQNVYCVARDGKQAGLQWRQGEQMVRASPTLAPKKTKDDPNGGLCTINMTDRTIVYTPTLSCMSVVAGDNEKSQEGLGGSVIVDETHVVDSDLMAILEGAGMGRSEPMQIEFSTAGNNPHGYGRKQYNYGKRVLSGDTVDEAFFFQAYEAPQNAVVTDDNYIALGKLANPSWGTLINPQKFSELYNRAKRSTTDFNNWKMYHLGIWQRASNPWIPEEAWAECLSKRSWRGIFRSIRAQKQRPTVVGRDRPIGFGGLDMGSKRDLTSFTLTIPREGGKFIQCTWLWMCRAAAELLTRNVEDVPDWIKRGFVRIAGTNKLDDDIVVQDIERLSKHVRIYEIGFDRMYAPTIMRYIADGLIRDGKVITSGVGCPCVEFNQTSASYALPTASFEKAFMEPSLEIVDNPCLTWMASHCEVRQDGNGNRKPEKPEGDDHRKIDGIVSSIMSLARAQARILVRPTISSF